MKIDISRNIALEALYKIDKEKSYSNIVLDEILNKNRKNIDNRDIGFISELVYGVTTWKLTLDYIIQKYSKTKVKKISKIIINILRIGAYQIIFLDKIPKSAAVNESVNLCKRYNLKSANFVNAILRKIDKKDYEELKDIKDSVQRISKVNSMPEWLVKELLNEYEEDIVEKICKNSNIKPKISIRINNLKTSIEDFKKKLVERNITFLNGNFDNFLYLENLKDLKNLDLYKDGLFTVQDEGAGLISIILNPKKGDKILDCCSAPGGKTTQIAEIIKNQGEIIAWDLYESRLKLVEENFKRLGINIIRIEENDSTILKEEYIEKFDKVLIDVPCMGLGVIRRKPDIKWQKEKEDIEDINKIQLDILEKCSKYLKKGGYLVYSTCSVIKKENINIIKQFLENTDFEIVDLQNNILLSGFEYLYNDSTIQLLPNNYHDGFFIALLQKRTN